MENIAVRDRIDTAAVQEDVQETAQAAVTVKIEETCRDCGTAIQEIDTGNTMAICPRCARK